MKRRDSLGGAAAGEASARAERSAPPKPWRAPPNVLVFFTDDHRRSGVGAYGNTEVRTPNLDRLAERGTIFTRAYLMGGFTAATCVPSRAQLLTGRSLWNLKDNRPRPEYPTLPQTFRENGYHTFFTGKRHALDGETLRRSFSDGGPVFGFGGYLCDKYRMPVHDWSPDGVYEKEKAYLLGPNGERNPVCREGPRGPLISEVFCESAARFVREYAGEKPWFMYLALPAPHDPHDAPEELRRLYDPGKISLPPNFLPEHPFDNGDMEVRDEKLISRPRDPAAVRQRTADYYAAVTHLDHQFGKVVAALEETGQLGNTIIVFAGDSGLAIGQHGLMGKQNLYDDSGMGIPLIMAGPGVPAGETREVLTCSIDVFPTLCELAGVTAPATLDGRSLVPCLRDPGRSPRERIYLAYLGCQRAVVERRYKLIEYIRWPRRGAVVGTRFTQLFDLEGDPWETTDLSGRAEHAGTISRLRREMRALADAHGDTAPASENAATDRGHPHCGLFWDGYESPAARRE